MKSIALLKLMGPPATQRKGLSETKTGAALDLSQMVPVIKGGWRANGGGGVSPKAWCSMGFNLWNEKGGT